MTRYELWWADTVNSFKELPMAKDKELKDHERAHSGQPGSKVKHGADAVRSPGKPRLSQGQQNAVMKDTGPDSIGGVLKRTADRRGSAPLGTGVEYTKPGYGSKYPLKGD